MRILSFDTSANEIHVAVLEDDRLLHEDLLRDTEGGTRQEAVAGLMPAVVNALAAANCHRNEIDCLVVGQGPGSFTGIRTAIVTARTLAQAMERPLVAVPYLECLAAVCELPAAVVISAGRGRFFAGAYRRQDNGDLESVVAPIAGEPAEIASALAAVPHWYCDDAGLSEFAAVVKKTSNLPIVENIATKQAQIAWNRVCLNESTETLMGDRKTLRKSLSEKFPYDAVSPLYLRNPSITLKKRDDN